MVGLGKQKTSGREPGRLLAVDDDEDFVESIKDVFELLGYDVRTARSLDKGLEVAKAFPAEVALIDVKLGHTNGVELIRPLRQTCPDVQCVMMTGYAAMDAIIEAFRLGAVDYLYKPVDMDILRSAVERAIDTVRQRRERMVATERLRKNEEQLRRIVESVGQEYFFFIEDGSHTLTYVSPSVRAVLGYTPEGLGSLWRFATEDKENQEAHARHEAVLTGKGTEPFEMTVLDAAGKVKRLRVVESPYRDEKGTIIGISGMAQDVTERR